MKKHSNPHYHMSIAQGDVVSYDYTDLWPTDPIRQFSSMLAMVDDFTYKKAGSEVASHFLVTEREGFNPYYTVNGEFMFEGVYKCNKPCYISPSMN